MSSGSYQRTLQVSPIHATLILHLEECELLTASELSERCLISECAVRKRMTSWLNQGIVADIGDGNYRSFAFGPKECLMAHETDMSPGAIDSGCEDEDKLSSERLKHRKVRERFAPYVTGMLTNLGSLSLEKMHNMLQMFVTLDDLDHAMTLGDLEDVLRYLCEREEVEFKGGIYHLRTKDA